MLNYFRRIGSSGLLTENPRVGSSILSLGTREKLTHCLGSGFCFFYPPNWIKFRLLHTLLTHFADTGFDYVWSDTRFETTRESVGNGGIQWEMLWCRGVACDRGALQQESAKWNQNRFWGDFGSFLNGNWRCVYRLLNHCECMIMALSSGLSLTRNLSACRKKVRKCKEMGSNRCKTLFS